MSTYEVVVIGAGMTGLTASKALAERGLRVANIEGGIFGGLITNVTQLDGEYGGAGADLASTLMSEATDLGCAMLSESATQVRREGSSVLVATDAGVHEGDCLIVASGARLKRLGVPGEMELEHKGVSQCADCDGPMFRGQDVVVVGGGDSALQEALVLSEFCASVRIVHDKPQLTAHRRWQDAILARANVLVLPDTEVTQIEGGDVVEGVRLRSLRDGGECRVPCAGVFVYVGLAPATAFLPIDVARDATGALITAEDLETSLDGVFAAGAVRAGYGGALADAVRDARSVAGTVTARLRD